VVATVSKSNKIIYIDMFNKFSQYTWQMKGHSLNNVEKYHQCIIK
jgi:hypothetical protein